MNSQRILIVEDDGIVGRDLQATLTRHGFSVPHVVRSGERALELAAETSPDLVLVDMALGGAMDGVETASRILEVREVPIVYLTGAADELRQRRAGATSPYGYVIKPCSETELLETVRTALARHASIRRLAASERRFVSALRSMAEGVITTDLAGNITFLNPTAESITGWSGLEAGGRPLKEIFRIRRPDGAEADPLPPGVLAGASRAILLTTKSGRTVPIEDNTAPIKDEQGSLTGLVVVFRHRDETEAKAGASVPPLAAPDAGGEHLARMVESIADPMFTMDADWRITYVNPRAAGYFGTTREEVLGRVFWDEFPAGVKTRYLADFTKALQGLDPESFEFHHEAKDLWFEVIAYPFADGLLALFKDVTAKKRAENDRTRFEQLEGLGYLARGFAHDFNNLLTVLLGNLSLGLSKVPDDAVFRPDLVEAKQASVQAQNLVQQLLTFAKGGAPIKKELHLGDLVERVMRDCQGRRQDTGLNYFYNVATDLWTVRADENQLLRLMNNLVRNAEQAVTTGRGDVMLQCKNLDAESALPDEALHLDPNTRYVLLKVIDNGEGIPEAIRHRIFEPYFSGRGKENTSGLGLTVCESIARAHGGFIVVDSREHHGTTVGVYLPVAHPPASIDTEMGGDDLGTTFSRMPGIDEFSLEPDSPDAAASSTIGTEPAERAAADTGGHATATGGGNGGVRRVLILEDERLIRELITRNLTEAGYEVETTEEGSRTLLVYKESMEHGRKFDLVVMDLSIPEGMGGAETMEQLRRMDPGVVAIVSSGYSDDPVMAHHEEYGFTAVLPKPYDPMELRRLVDDILDKPANAKR